MSSPFMLDVEDSARPHLHLPEVPEEAKELVGADTDTD